MKKLYIFKSTKFWVNIINLLLLILGLSTIDVYAYTGAINSYFSIDSQTSEPYHFNINANSSANHVFHIDYTWNHGSGQEYDSLGNYFMVSIVSTQQLSIKRQYNFGSNCSSSCFANEVYLQNNGYNNGSYDYILYFNASKWSSNIGTQIDLYSIADSFTFTNKGNSQATVYFYGAYASDNNMIPDLISNAQVSESVTIMGEQVTQDIIDNANQNTQEIIDSNMVCQMIDNNNIVDRNHYLEVNGDLTSNNNVIGITDYIKLDSKSKLKIITPRTQGASYCFYNSEKTLISCSNNYSITDVTIPNTASYFRASIHISQNKPQFQICKNGNQSNYEAINDVNNSINNVNNSINNSNIDNPDNDFSDMEDLIAHNGVITNLIALPITLYTSILNNVNSTCNSFNLGNLYNKNITFTCINLGNILGSTIWGVIDVLFSGFTIYAISKKMIKVFQNFSGLQEGDVIDD